MIEITGLELEAPIIGDALAEESSPGDDCLGEAGIFWEGSRRWPDHLADTSDPGDVHLAVLRDQAEPLFDRDSFRLDPAWVPATPDVEAIMRDLCHGLGIWYPGGDSE